MSERRIEIVLDSKRAKMNAEQLDRSMVGVGSSADGAQFKVKKLAAAIATIVTGRQIIQFFTDVMRVSAGFEQSMAQVGAVARATDAELVALTATARRLGATTEFTASQAASGLEFLARAGFNASQSIAALPAVLDLATASGMDLGQAADVTSNIMSGFGIAAEDSAQVADVLAAASTRANTNVEMLGEGMKFVAPVAAAMEVSIGDAAAAMGVLSDAGIQGSMAGTGLRRVLAGLANPTGEAEKTLKSLGITLDQVNPQTNDLADIVDLLAKKGLTAAEALTIFGQRGGPAILALTDGVPKLRRLSEEMNHVDDEAKRIAETFRDTLSGDVKTLQSAFQDLQISLGDMFNASARENVQDLTEAIRFASQNLGTIVDIVEVLSVMIGTRLAVALASSTVAMLKKNAAALATTSSMNKYTGAITRTTVAQNLMTASANKAKAAMALMGGPLGVFALAAAGIAMYVMRAKEAVDANNVLSRSIENLTENQLKLEKIHAEKAFVAAKENADNLRQEIENLTARWSEFSGSLANKGKRLAIAERIAEARAELDGADQSAEKLEKRLRTISNMISGDTNSALNEREYGITDDPFDNPDRLGLSSGDDVDAGRNVDTNDNEKTVQRMKEGTAQLTRELDLRRTITDLYRREELDAMASQFDKERAMEEIRRQEQIANLTAQYQEDQERREIQLGELLEKMGEDDEAKKELKAEFDNQEELAREIFQEKLTSIDEKGARDREQIAQQEANARIDAWSNMASSGLRIIQSFGSSSFQSQKNFAIADSIIAITAGVAKALDNPYPANLGFAASVAAQGATLISTLRSTNPRGGGTTPTVSASNRVNSLPDRQQQQPRNFGTLKIEGLDDDALVSGAVVKKIMGKIEESWEAGDGIGRMIYS